MEHIEERILELYVLRDPETLRDRERIERHCERCAACRQTVEHLRTVYEHAEEEIRVERTQEQSASRAIIRRPGVPPIVPVSGPPRLLLGSYSLTMLAFVARRHPVVASTGGVLMTAAFIMLAVLSYKSVTRDDSPAYIHYNRMSETVEVYNTHNTVLWQFPSSDVEYAAKHPGQRQTFVADLDGDGKREVVTVLPVGNQPQRGMVRIFNTDGSLRLGIDFPPRRMEFGGVRYDLQPAPYMAVPVVNRETGRTELIVSAVTGRSPSFLARLSHRGELLGTVWTFGGMSMIYPYHNGSGDRILACGLNDVDEDRGGRFTMAAVIDPMKISGESESIVSRGFGFPSAVCEELLVRFPSNDMLEALHMDALAASMEQTSDSTLNFTIVPFQTPESTPNFQFVFTGLLRIREVKPSDYNKPLHARLKAEGKIDGMLDRAYHERLRDGVRYWSGTAWQPEWTTVTY